MGCADDGGAAGAFRSAPRGFSGHFPEDSGEGRDAAPSAAILDSRTLQSTPESGGRASYDGAKRRKGSKVHAAVGTLGHLLAPKVTAAHEQDRAQAEDLARAVQAATGDNVQLTYVDQGCTGERPAADAAQHGIKLEVVGHIEAKRGFVLLHRRRGVERSSARAARFRRPARDYERLAYYLAAYHWLAFALLMLQSLFAKCASQDLERDRDDRAAPGDDDDRYPDTTGRDKGHALHPRPESSITWT